MPNPEQPPTNPEQGTFAQQETFRPRQEIIQFNDGELALSFSTPDDELHLGPDSTHKYARNFYGDDMAIMATKSGNTYGLARGLVINEHLQRANKLPEATIPVTIGEPCVIPSVGTTTSVESVMLRYKVAPSDSEMADRQVDIPSPFKALEARAEAINDGDSLSE